MGKVKRVFIKLNYLLFFHLGNGDSPIKFAFPQKNTFDLTSPDKDTFHNILSQTNNYYYLLKMPLKRCLFNTSLCVLVSTLMIVILDCFDQFLLFPLDCLFD